jgi:GWxTD domain-containing protein
VTLVWLALALGTGGAAPPAAAQDGDGLAVRTVRFYRGDRTLVNSFVRVPHLALDPVSLGDGAFAAFRVDVEVVDTAGTVLTRETWTRRVSWTATRIPGTSSVETLSFALAPGEYGVRVTLTDSASGRKLASQTRVTAYDRRPAVSDVLLAQRIRSAAGTDTTPAPGEIRKGDLLMAAGPTLVLRPTAATLYVYGEAYRDEADTIAWQLEVLDAQGGVLLSAAPQKSAVGAGGGVLTGGLNLAGLPPGAYQLRAVVTDGGQTTRRTAGFEMAGLDLEGRLAQVSQDLDTPADTFARAPDEVLDALFAPLSYVPEAGDLRAYESLSTEAKRRFLRTFWARRDPTLGTPVNEAMVGFYQRIATATRRFAEGGAGSVPGWRTDRGRIYVIHGEPDDVLRRPSTGPAPPWEVWKYSQDRPRKYVFLDETRLGHFALIYSDDRQERSYPNWDAIIGQEASDEILRF